MKSYPLKKMQKIGKNQVIHEVIHVIHMDNTLINGKKEVYIVK